MKNYKKRGLIQAGADHSDVIRSKSYDENMLRFRNYEQEAKEHSIVVKKSIL